MTGQPLAAYHELITRLETERAKALRNAPAATVEEVRCTLDGIASGIHIAIAHAINLFEGHDARIAHFNGGQLAAHDSGPSVRECADADRAWPLQKAGE